MNIQEAKFVSEWNRNPAKMMWHPDTEEALDWAIEEIESRDACMGNIASAWADVEAHFSLAKEKDNG